MVTTVKPDTVTMHTFELTKSESVSTKKADSYWFTVSLYVELEKYLSRYNSLRASTRKLVDDMIYFRKPDRGLYEREVGGVFIGYVFVKLKPKNVMEFQRALKAAGLGEILGYSDGVARPLTQEEFSHITEVMKSHKQPRFSIGKNVVVKNGPYEGLEGLVSNIIGQQITVKFQLRRSISYADISIENLDEVA